MREISQTRHVKVTDVAATIIKAHRSVDQPGAGEQPARRPAPSRAAKAPGPAARAGRRAGQCSGQAATRKPSASRSSAGRPETATGSDRS